MNSFAKLALIRPVTMFKSSIVPNFHLSLCNQRFTLRFGFSGSFLRTKPNFSLERQNSDDSRIQPNSTVAPVTHVERKLTLVSFTWNKDKKEIVVNQPQSVSNFLLVKWNSFSCDKDKSQKFLTEKGFFMLNDWC